MLLASGCRGSLNREGSIGWRTIRALTFPQEQGKLPNPLIGSFFARANGRRGAANPVWGMSFGFCGLVH
jgi:hypothetical protein